MTKGGVLSSFFFFAAGVLIAATSPVFAQMTMPKDYEQISDEPSLPDLPTFSGPHTMTSGLHFPDSPGGASYILRFSTSSEPRQIIDWYRSALTSYGWKLLPQGRQFIRATKERNVCTVAIVSASPGEKNAYTVTYRLGGKKR